MVIRKLTEPNFQKKHILLQIYTFFPVHIFRAGKRSTKGLHGICFDRFYQSASLANPWQISFISLVVRIEETEVIYKECTRGIGPMLRVIYRNKAFKMPEGTAESLYLLNIRCWQAHYKQILSISKLFHFRSVKQNACPFTDSPLFFPSPFLF